MKRILLITGTALLLLSKSMSAQNLIVNSDFEIRNAVPSTQSNVGPATTLPYAPFYRQDDLPNWDSPAIVQPVSSHTPPEYISTDGLNNQNFSFLYHGGGSIAPHSGLSSVVLLQHDVPNDYLYDQFITQQLAQPLLPGHLYQVQFWTIRPAPTSAYRTRLAVSITDNKPVFDDNQNSLIPSPGSKVFISDDIQPQSNWTLVTGNIYIPTNQIANQWITIGYDRGGQQYDPSLNNPNIYVNSASIRYLIDDVSLMDMGIPCPSNLALTAYVDGQQIAPSSTPSQSSNAEVNIYTPVTFGVSGNYVGTCTWSVYTSAGPYSYTSSTYGNTFTITPRAPQSPTAPGGATNSAQYYGITCTVTYPGCGTSSNLEFGLYSKQSNSGGGGGGDAGDPDLGRSASTTDAYPNPASESITIPAGIKDAELLNDQGKTLQRADASGHLNVQSIPEGLYNLQMRQNGKLINQRIQVKH